MLGGSWWWKSDSNVSHGEPIQINSEELTSEEHLTLAEKIRKIDPRSNPDVYTTAIEQYLRDKTKSEDFVTFLCQDTINEISKYIWTELPYIPCKDSHLKAAIKTTFLGIIFNFLHYISKQSSETESDQANESLMDQVFNVVDGKKGDLNIAQIFSQIPILTDPDRSVEAIEGAEKNVTDCIKRVLAVSCPDNENSLILPIFLDYEWLGLRKFIWSKLTEAFPKKINSFFLTIRTIKGNAEKNRKLISQHDPQCKHLALVDTLGKNFSCFIEGFLTGEEKTEKKEEAKEGELFQKTILKILDEIKIRKKDELQIVIDQAKAYGEPILLHLFAGFAVKHKEGTLLASIIRNPLEFVFNFTESAKGSIIDADQQFEQFLGRRRRVEGSTTVGKLEQKKIEEEKALQPLKYCFTSLAKGLLKENGFDEKGLEEFLPFGAKKLEEKIQEELVDFFVDFYRESVSFVALKKTPLCIQQAKLTLIEETILVQEQVVVHSLVNQIYPSLIDSLSKDKDGKIGEAVINTCNEKLLFPLDSVIDKEFFSSPIKQLLNNPAVMNSFGSFPQEFISGTILNILSHLSFGQGKCSLFPGALETILDIIDSKISFQELQHNIFKWMTIPEEEKGERDAREAIKKELRKFFEGKMKLEGLQIQDSNLLEDLKKWKELPIENEELIEKKNSEKIRILKSFDSPKEKEKAKLQKSLEPIAEELFFKGGWSNPKNIPVPTKFKDSLKKSMKEVILPDFLIEFFGRLLILQGFSEEENDLLCKMTSQEELKQLKAICSTNIPKILHGLGTEDSPKDIAFSLMGIEGICQIPSEQAKAVLGKDLQLIAQTQQFFPQNKKFLGIHLSFLPFFCMSNLALNSPSSSNDLMLRAIHFLESIFNESKIQDDVVKKIEFYDSQRVKLKELEGQLKILREQAVLVAPNCPDELLKVIEEKKQECYTLDPRPILSQLKEEFDASIERSKESEIFDIRQMKLKNDFDLKRKLAKKLDDEDQELLKIFQSISKHFLHSLGFSEAKKVPLPFLDDEAWGKITTTSIPKLLLEAYRTLWVPDPIYVERRENLEKRYPGQVAHLDSLVRLYLNQIRHKMSCGDKGLYKFLKEFCEELGFKDEWLLLWMADFAQEKNNKLWAMISDFVVLRVQEMAAQVLLEKRKSRRSNLLHDLLAELYVPLDKFVDTKGGAIQNELHDTDPSKTNEGRKVVANKYFSDLADKFIKMMGWDTHKAYCIPFFGKSIEKNLKEKAPEYLLDFFFPAERSDNDVAKVLSSSVKLAQVEDKPVQNQKENLDQDEDFLSFDEDNSSETSTSPVKKGKKTVQKSHLLTEVLGERLQQSIIKHLNKDNEGIKKAADKFLVIFNVEGREESIQIGTREWVHQAFSHIARSSIAQEVIEEIPEKITALVKKNEIKGQDLYAVIIECLKSPDTIGAIQPVIENKEGLADELLLKKLTDSAEKLVDRTLQAIEFSPRESLPLPEVTAGKVWQKNLKPALIEQLAKMFFDLSAEYRQQNKYVESLRAEGIQKEVDQHADFTRQFALALINKKENQEKLVEAILSFVTGKEKEESDVTSAAKHNVMKAEIEHYLPFLTDPTVQMVAHGEIKALLYRCFSVACDNLKKLEDADRTRMFKFAMDIVKRLTDHLLLIKGVAKTNRKKVSELGYKDIEKEYRGKKIYDPEKKKALDQELTEIIWDRELLKLNKQIDQKEKDVDAFSDSPSIQKKHLSALKELKKQKELKEKQIYGEVDKEFLLWALQIAGIHDPSDLPGLPEYAEEVWEVITEKLGPSLVGGIFDDLFNPKALNTHLLELLQLVNKHLQNDPKQSDKPIEPIKKKPKKKIPETRGENKPLLQPDDLVKEQKVKESVVSEVVPLPETDPRNKKISLTDLLDEVGLDQEEKPKKTEIPQIENDPEPLHNPTELETSEQILNKEKLHLVQSSEEGSSTESTEPLLKENSAVEQQPKLLSLTEEEREKYIKDCNVLLKNLGRALPGALGTCVSLTSSLSSPKLVDALHGALQEWTLLKIMKEGITKGAEKLPGILEDFKNDAKKKPATEEEICDEIIKILPNTIESCWKSFQKRLDDWFKNQGDYPAAFKSYLDQICRAIFIDFFAAIIWWILERPVNYLTKKYARDIRQNSVETPVHAQLARGILRDLMSRYKVEVPKPAAEPAPKPTAAKASKPTKVVL